MLPVPTVAQLAGFTGRPESGYTSFADQALAQAALLFTIVTQRPTLPDDPDTVTLVRNAILEMADRIYLEQPYAAARVSPYQSETIGSYSYAKSSTVVRARDRPG